MNTDRNPWNYYSETQYFRQRWILLLVLAISAISWYTFIAQILLGHKVGNQPGENWMVWLTWLFAGLLLPLFLFITKLIVSVQKDQVLINFYPIKKRTILLSEIVSANAVTYQPIKEFGGWGIRWGGKGKKAYNMSGNQGVELKLTDETTVLIGSQNAKNLAAIINREISKLNINR